MATAIIAGTGFTLETAKPLDITTPYGQAVGYELDTYANLTYYLPRHGKPHTLVPHRINYRANIWAPASLGVKNIIAIAAVGGINTALPPAYLAVPEQIIDYTYGRGHTFFEEENVGYIEFSQPYDEVLRQKLITQLLAKAIPHMAWGVYGVTQGPRLETQAEIARMQRDGCDMVGMTAMPEAALAREKGIAYASLAVCANWAAGIGGEEIAMDEIEANLAQGMQSVKQVLEGLRN